MRIFSSGEFWSLPVPQILQTKITSWKSFIINPVFLHDNVITRNLQDENAIMRIYISKTISSFEKINPFFFSEIVIFPNIPYSNI